MAKGMEEWKETRGGLEKAKTLNKEKRLFIISPKKYTCGHWENPEMLKLKGNKRNWFSSYA